MALLEDPLEEQVDPQQEDLEELPMELKVALLEGPPLQEQVVHRVKVHRQAGKVRMVLKVGLEGHLQEEDPQQPRPEKAVHQVLLGAHLLLKEVQERVDLLLEFQGKDLQEEGHMVLQAPLVKVDLLLEVVLVVVPLRAEHMEPVAPLLHLVLVVHPEEKECHQAKEGLVQENLAMEGNQGQAKLEWEDLVQGNLAMEGNQAQVELEWEDLVQGNLAMEENQAQVELEWEDLVQGNLGTEGNQAQVELEWEELEKQRDSWKNQCRQMKL